MDFKNWQIIKTDKEVKVRPKYEIDWRFPIGVYNENEIDLYQAFETFANQHTYTVANPQDIPEGVTEVRREDVEVIEVMGETKDGWIDPSSTRQVVYYSPKQEEYPDKCPVTGKKFFMLLEDESGEIVPTYGGPFDSYTIPVKDEDGEYCTERYCHDSGAWMGIEVIEVEEQEKPKEEESELASKLQEIHDLLMNMQPKIPGCCYPNKVGFIDTYVDLAMEKLQELINENKK